MTAFVGSGAFRRRRPFQLADILLFVFIEFAGQVGQPLDAANKNLTAWRARVAARPSAAASA